MVIFGSIASRVACAPTRRSKIFTDQQAKSPLCPPSKLTRALTQQQINSMGWIQPLSASPPKPPKNPINKKNANNWVASHVGDKGRQLAQTLINNIRYIPQEEFEEALRCSVEDFNQKIDDTGYIVVGRSPQNSNFWTASLALKNLKVMPTDVVEIEDLPKALKRHPKVHQIALLDDAIYTGKQIGRIQSACIGALQEAERANPEIHVIAPFQVDERRAMSYYSPIPIHVAKHQKLKLLREVIPEHLHKAFSKMFAQTSDFDPATEKPLVYFDHKIPDSVSTLWEQLADGRLGKDISSLVERFLDFSGGLLTNEKFYEEPFIAQIIPPYKKPYLPAPKH
ncbi:MAG: hypothetical protein COT85_05755 [Chlamydiae bacterium CG10_big_fil_rev_8_21_14_0_10_42_34]|nr:MAG: hypothetical protein COT85_05755 [Chlamydiae bacterium CG10_big_fil_rev_8_21_14_0_10_42_34]